MKASTYYGLGLMSGSSLDGLDLAYCKMSVSQNPLKIEWQLLKAITLPFSETWVRRLAHLPEQSAKVLAQTNVYFSYYIAELIKPFMEKEDLKIDFIASHGHTIFHYPDKRFTCQIGDGGALAAATQCTVVSNFRTQDITLNGEGTPIAPAADKYLFPDFDFYLNIGGIANISCQLNDIFIAFDTAPANQILNPLAQLNGIEYDMGGNMAAKGNIQADLLAQLHDFPYWKKDYPKSLDNQWIKENVLPLLLRQECSLEDKMATAVEFSTQLTRDALQRVMDKEKIPTASYNMLCTGGGTFNTFYLNSLKEKCEPLGINICIPKSEIIAFKEAILMVLMGVLRVEKLSNCFRSVTGAQRDTIGGAIYVG